MKKQNDGKWKLFGGAALPSSLFKLMNKKALIKYLLIFAGSLSLLLGTAGIFLPVLPTTPFLLLSAFCYLKSSDKLYAWLTGNRFLGPYISNYLKYKAIKRRAKITGIAFLWIFLTVSMILVDSIWTWILLPLVGTAVTIHILSIKTLPPNPDKQESEQKSKRITSGNHESTK
ncbi:MAG: YbaN family protein [Clostridia bacterium]